MRACERVIWMLFVNLHMQGTMGMILRVPEMAVSVLRKECGLEWSVMSHRACFSICPDDCPQFSFLLPLRSFSFGSFFPSIHPFFK